MAVLDLREIIPGASLPKGHNSIVVLSKSGKILNNIAYATERPLSCRDQKLLLQGYLAVNRFMPEGNVLSFNNKGRLIAVEQVDAQALWPPD